MINNDFDKLCNAFYSKNVVVITGAGISTLSGIPDFRGANGLYNKNIDAEKLLSIDYLNAFPLEFYEFYKSNMMVNNYEPNIIHTTLSNLEKSRNINCIITQNIDNLHQKAGSKNVISLHGNGEQFYCINCHSEYNSSFYVDNGCICPICSSIIRPNIVLYGEKIQEINNWKSNYELSKADVLIVLGSSILVSTVSDLIKNYIHNKRLNHKLTDSFYIINKNATPYDYFSTKYECDLELAFQKILRK